MPDQPNIVLLLLDAARRDRMSCYGYNRNTTPQIDQISKSGTLYENAYSQSIWSLPSYASIFTGEYPSNHQAIDWGDSVEKNSLVESLNESGYETICSSPHLISGEFGLADDFDVHEWVSVEGREFIFDPDPVIDKLHELGQKGEINSKMHLLALVMSHTLKYKSIRTVPNSIYWLYIKIIERLGYWGDDGGKEVTDRAIRQVSNAQEPYFLFANFTEPHYQYRPPKEYIHKFVDNSISVSDVNEALKMREISQTASEQEMTDEMKDLLISLCDSCLNYSDSQVGRILENINLQKSVVIILSDHGDLHGEWGIWGHQARVHRHLCNVPLIIHYPWQAPTQVDSPVELRSIYDLTKSVSASEKILLEEKEYAISEYYGWDTQLSITPWDEYESVDKSKYGTYQVSCATRDWRLLLDSEGGEELYDINSDPDELNDVSENNPGVVQLFKQYIIDEVGDPVENHDQYRLRDKNGTFDEISDNLQDRLGDLGYIQ